MAVVGAGPAGARAAELLARMGVDVLLIDPKVPWEKPCGGGLTSPLFDELPDLEEVRTFAQCVTTAWIALSPDAGIEVPLGKPIWIVSREALARWQLQRAATAGAVHEPTRVTAIERAGDLWCLHTASGTLLVSALVGADGAASTARGAAAPSLPIELIPTHVAYPRREASLRNVVVLRFYGDMTGYLPRRFFGQLREALHDVRVHPHRRGSAQRLRDPERPSATPWTSSN